MGLGPVILYMLISSGTHFQHFIPTFNTCRIIDTWGVFMGRIRDTFLKLERSGECAFIAYLMAGDPDPVQTPRIATAIARYADILELGIPFSDPIADGKTIQAASERALRAGMTPKKIFEHVAAIRRETEIPIVVMSYYNPIVQFGVDRFMNRFAL
ncbi:MAG: tryptophan synthase subunit alpha, partial [Methanophagales archaeon ANME-1-THS]